MRIESFIPKTKRQRLYEKYLYFKLFYGRGSTYFSIPMGLAGAYMVYTLWFQMYLKIYNKILLNVIATFVILVIISIGYIDVKNQLIHEETSFFNKYNPELQYIKEKVKREKE